MWASLRSAKVQAAVAIVLIVVGVLALKQVSQMDGRFFQPSLRGVQGLGLYLVGDYAGAARAYRAHFRERPNELAPGNPALNALIRGDRGEARRLVAKILQGSPDNIGALLTLGQLELEEGANVKALNAFERVLASRTDQYDALLLSSVALAQTGASGKAIDALNRALRHDWLEDRLISFLSVLEATGQLASLRSDKRPNCLLATYHRYLRIYDGSHAGPAVAYAGEAIKAGDRPADAYLTIGIVHDKRNDPEAALVAFRKAIEIDPTHAEAHRRAAIAFGDLGDLANQYRMYRAAFAAAPEDALYARELSFFLRTRLGDYSAALELALGRHKENPYDVEAITQIAFLYNDLGEFDRSIEYARRGLTMAPRHDDLYDALSQSLARLGRFDEAIKVGEAWIARSPRNGGAHAHLGDYYVRANRIKEARRALEYADELGALQEDGLSELCTLYFRIQENERALGCFRRVLAANPGSTKDRYYISLVQQSIEMGRAQR
jgi:tetratricopeptide (TPR) repeat protein